MKSKATSFATYQDLVAYIKCLQGGGSTNHCYNYGDNGIGSWGDVTATEKVAYVALSPQECEKKWGTVNRAHGKKVKVTLRGITFEAAVGDKGPEGVIDLNPGSLKAAGLDVETELNEECDWEWAD